MSGADAGGDEEERFAHLRAAPRDSMFLLASIRRAGGAEVPIKVRNLSQGGMMAECAISFSREEAILIELRGIGEVSGRVAWTAGGKIGVAFDREIDPKLARKPVTGNPQPQLVKASKSMWRPGLR
ncbi:PilZ domain-containing protein [Sphingomonas sp. BIUV-7]|uniref:PilZ domain-containing protein n=1 Tax=Sphingomonas natans TaxID=3063330 RepID=A0ABT8YBL3_9SPHN|nr:PilZ domain-containing protein [Sphingomonas sp. BIUV-7]